MFLSKRWSCGKGQRGTQIPNLSVDQLSLFIIIFDSSAKSEKPQIFTTQLKHETEEEYPYAAHAYTIYMRTYNETCSKFYTYNKTRSKLYIH